MSIALCLVGAFYVFAGIVLARVTLTSRIVDQGIAALTLERTPAAETAKTAWSLGLATLVYAGGLAALLMLEVAAALFVAAALAQAAYVALAPRLIDGDAGPSEGRRQTINAFVIYLAATAFVLWAWHRGGLQAAADTPWPVLAGAGAAMAVFLSYVGWHGTRPLAARGRD